MNYANPIIEAGAAARRAKANEIVAVARWMAQAGSQGGTLEALKRAEAGHATPAVRAILNWMIGKSSVGAETIAGTLPLAEYSSAVDAFFDSVAYVGAFDRMRPDMAMVPLHSRAVAFSLGSASTVGEGQISPATMITTAGKQTDLVKALSIVAVSKELMAISDTDLFNLLGRLLRTSVALETDLRFLALITAGLSPVASNGGTAIAILQDIAGAAATLTTGASSKLYIVVGADTAKAWATKTTSTGELAFPNMTPQGGTIAGFTVIVSDGAPAGTFTMIDASQILASAGTLDIASSTQADLIFDTAPASPPSASAVMKSLFQHNLIALKVTRYFSAQRARDTAVAVVNGLAYTGNSPA